MPTTPRRHVPPPSTIIVGPFTYDVVFDIGALAALAVKKGVAVDELAGVLDAPSLRILVDPSTSPGRMVEVIAHETVHALFELLGLDELLGAKEETVVRALAPALVDTLRRSPDLVAYIVA